MRNIMRKFRDGVIFGTGFGVSFITLWGVFSYFISPHLVTANIQAINSEINSFNPPPSSIKTLEPSTNFHELNIEQKIEKSSVILLAEYKQAKDGKFRVIIKEFIKAPKDTKFYYSIGEEYENSSFYPEKGVGYGEGEIMFFIGSPATLVSSMTHENNRIRGLGNMPIDLIRTMAN